MKPVVVTLEVSKLSGWLNADAPCRESNGGHMRCGARCGPGGGRRRVTAVQAACRGKIDCRSGAGHGEERTRNMSVMVVTLDVSKLSGWSNADAEENMLRMFVTLDVSKFSGWSNANAPCRDERRGYAMRDEVRAGRRESVGRRRPKKRARGEPRLKGWGPRQVRSARRTSNVCLILDAWKHARRGPD